MSAIVFLDSSPLGLVSVPRETPESRECYDWFRELLRAGHRVIVPEIAD